MANQKKPGQGGSSPAQQHPQTPNTMPSTEPGRIPRQAMMDDLPAQQHPSTRVVQHTDNPKVIIKQTPVPEVRIYNKTSPKKYSLGMKASDALTRWGGSWYFISFFMVFLVIWMLINFYVIVTVWDPYPFILLNLVLSCLAAIQAPVILMSQNRAAERDRTKAERDYAVNRKAEREVELIKKDLDFIKKKLAQINARVK